MNPCIHIGSRREFFFDDTLVDTAQSNTVFKLHEPVQRECVLTWDQPWAKTGSFYHSVLPDGEINRLYITMGGNIAYAESRDGIHWECPDLGIVEVNGNRNNSYLFDPDDPHYFAFDGFRVFKDTNPACPPEERYKALANEFKILHCYTSPDGIHFQYKAPLAIDGYFDSINTVFYNDLTGKYNAFVRNFHPTAEPGKNTMIRDIRYAESPEMFPEGGWPLTKLLEYSCGEDWQMYINSIMPYYRAPHVLIGFPSRYVERKEWTDNYDELCGSEDRLRRTGPTRTNRHGLAINDTLFMTSRDGLHWTRYPDAFVRPGPEHPTNWVYGNVYFSNGIIETKSSHPGCDNELSFYCLENRFADKPVQVYRYTIRLDGFVSMSSVYPESNLYTKPFIFEGKDLFINFATSAYGFMTFTIKDADGNSISSCQTFGDSTDRRVRFKGDLSAFVGKPVTMRVNMVDADLYSFIFR